MSAFRDPCTHITAAFNSFQKEGHPELLANAIKVAGNDTYLQSHYVDRALSAMMTAQAETSTGRIEMITAGLKAVASMSDVAAQRFNRQYVSAMSNSQSGKAAYKIAQTALELQGVNMEDVHAHGFVCRDFSLSKAGAGRSPILFVPENQIFARHSGFIGQAQAFADDAKQTARSEEDIQFARLAYDQTRHHLGAREWLPTLPQAVTLLQEKVQKAAAPRAAPGTLRHA